MSPSAVKSVRGEGRHGLCLAGRRRIVIHIYLAGDHPVVHLAALGGAAAIVRLELHIGGDDVDPGAGVGLHLPAKGPGQPGGPVDGAHPLAVGGVGQNDGLGAGGKVLHVRHLEMAALVDPCQPGVGPGQLDGGRVDVIAETLKGRVLPDLGQGLLALGGPDLRRHKAVPLGGKAALQAGGHVQGLLGRLDDQGAAAAEGVLHHTVPAHPAQVGDGGGQGLPQRGLHGVAAVAPLVQALAAGVQHDLAQVLPQQELHPVLAARLGQHRGAVPPHQPLDDGLFDDALAGGHAGQLAVQGRALDRERRVCGQQLLPGDGVDPVEEVVEGLGLVAGQQQQHPLHRAQVEVGGSDHLGPAPEGEPPVGDPQVLRAQPPQLEAGGGLTAKKAGGDQFVGCRHGTSFLFCDVKTGPPLKRRARSACTSPAAGQARCVACDPKKPLSGRRAARGRQNRPAGRPTRGPGRPASTRSGS